MCGDMVRNPKMQANGLVANRTNPLDQKDVALSAS